MPPIVLFSIQFTLSLLAYALIGFWYVRPRLARLPLEAALAPLVWVHAFRVIGGTILAPGSVDAGVPLAFRVMIGYGDLATQGFNIFGSVDYRRQGEIAAKQRPYANTAYLPNLGINRLSSNSVPANISTSSGLVNPYGPKYVGVANSCAQPASSG